TQWRERSAQLPGTASFNYLAGCLFWIRWVVGRCCPTLASSPDFSFAARTLFADICNHGVLAQPYSHRSRPEPGLNDQRRQQVTYEQSRFLRRSPASLARGFARLAQ